MRLSSIDLENILSFLNTQTAKILTIHFFRYEYYLTHQILDYWSAVTSEKYSWLDDQLYKLVFERRMQISANISGDSWNKLIYIYVLFLQTQVALIRET